MYATTYAKRHNVCTPQYTYTTIVRVRVRVRARVRVRVRVSFHSGSASSTCSPIHLWEGWKGYTWGIMLLATSSWLSRVQSRI